ncbi:MAG: hypothetical protein WCP92_00355 [bacterium]
MNFKNNRFLRFLKSWKVVKVATIFSKKVTIKVEEENKPTVFVTIKKRELNPLANIVNLIGLGIKIVEPCIITNAVDFGKIALTPDIINKLVMLIPTGENSNKLKEVRFSSIAFNESVSYSKEKADWLSATRLSDYAPLGTVQNLFELSAFANGSNFILE